MKNLILILLAALTFQSCKTHTLEEFKQYHPDAPNMMANRIGNFKGWCKVNWGSHDDGQVIIFMDYVTNEDKRFIAFAQFKYNGTIEFFNDGQTK